jgi:hypothetical protein
MSWAAKGTKSVSDRAKEDEENRKRGPKRFWMRNDSQTDITFVDDAQFAFYEHQVKIGIDKGAFQNFVTCPRPDDTTAITDCPLCAAGHKRRLVFAWTILDRTEFEYKGKEYKNLKRLFVATSKVAEKLEVRSNRKKAEGRAAGLAGLVAHVARGEGKSANTGDDFEFYAEASPKALTDNEGNTAAPYDYMDILKPDEQKLNAWVAHCGGAASSRTSSRFTEDDPF